jgi:hypothetical protein
VPASQQASNAQAAQQQAGPQRTSHFASGLSYSPSHATVSPGLEMQQQTENAASPKAITPTSVYSAAAASTNGLGASDTSRRLPLGTGSNALTLGTGNGMNASTYQTLSSRWKVPVSSQPS